MIEMDQVPKILRNVVKEWGADGLVVSFKVRSSAVTSALAGQATDSLVFPRSA